MGMSWSRQCPRNQNPGLLAPEMATACLVLLFPPALSPALARARFALLLAAATPALLAASALLVHGGPSAAFRFFLRCAAFFVTLFNMLRFPFLFAAIFRFAPTCHN